MKAAVLLLTLIVLAQATEPPSASASVPKPPRNHVLEQGETLWDLAESYYGNRHYSLIIMLHNRIESAERVAAGDTVVLQDLTEILSSEMGTAAMQHEIQLIGLARRAYMAVEPRLFAIREAAPQVVGDPEAPRPALQMPEDVVTQLREASAALRKSSRGFASLSDRDKTAGGPTSSLAMRSPMRAVRRLESAAAILDDLAAGSNDGYGYDMDMVHQHLAWGIRNLILWARDGYR